MWYDFPGLSHIRSSSNANHVLAFSVISQRIAFSSQLTGVWVWQAPELQGTEVLDDSCVDIDDMSDIMVVQLVMLAGKLPVCELCC